MKKWEQELKHLPTDANGRKATQEPTSTEIVLEFLRDEIYPRLKFAQDNFAKQELHATIQPVSPEEISTKPSIVSISLQRQLSGTHYEYSLQFKREEGFEIGVELKGKHGHTTLGTFAIDREPESPATLVEMYIEQFKEHV
jgi:hypothetical protein